MFASLRQRRWWYLSSFKCPGSGAMSFRMPISAARGISYHAEYIMGHSIEIQLLVSLENKSTCISPQIGLLSKLIPYSFN